MIYEAKNNDILRKAEKEYIEDITKCILRHQPNLTKVELFESLSTALQDLFQASNVKISLEQENNDKPNT